MDFTTLLTAVDFTDAAAGIGGAAAAMMVPVIALVGWRFFRRVFSS